MKYVMSLYWVDRIRAPSLVQYSSKAADAWPCSRFTYFVVRRLRALLISKPYMLCVFYNEMLFLLSRFVSARPMSIASPTEKAIRD